MIIVIILILIITNHYKALKLAEIIKPEIEEKIENVLIIIIIFIFIYLLLEIKDYYCNNNNNNVIGFEDQH